MAKGFFLADVKKLSLIILWPIAALSAIVYGRFAASGLSVEAQEIIAASHQWLTIVIALYIMNFFAAWRWSDLWPLSLSRLLIWAVIAYLCISKTIDLIGETPESRWQLIGVAGAAEADLLTQIRAELSVWLTALAMSLTAIAVGFEKQIHDSDATDKPPEV